MLIPDCHEWTVNVGDKIKQSCDSVWQVMVDEWCKQCLSDSDKKSFIDEVSNIVDKLIN